MKLYKCEVVNILKRQSLHFMDFTTTREYPSNNCDLDVAKINKKYNICNLSSGSFGKALNLAQENQDLIQVCLADKTKSVLSLKELEKYGPLALSTAALDCTNKNEYRSFAKKRLENMLNGAIAEAHLIQELDGKHCGNNRVRMEFTSIEETCC